jgi:voltage-gated potassium channel
VSRTLSPLRLVFLAATLFVLVNVVGTLAYVIIEGAPLFDALYLTVIAVTTAGFSETIPLDTSGRIVTMALIVMGVGSLTFATVTGIDFLVEGHLRDMLGRRRLDRQLERSINHTIVCGFGRVGRAVAAALRDEGTDVVVVDPAPERIALAIEASVPCVEGDASHEEMLRRAGIGNARGVVACTADDAENILIALTAKGLRPDLFVVVRVKDEESADKARRAGADRVIAPTAIGGRRIAALITRPAVVDFLDVVTHGTDVDLVLEEIELTERSSLAGTRLRDAQLRRRYGANVLAVRSVAHGMTTRPDPDATLSQGDVLVVIGGREDLDRLQADS